jgi:deoxyribodipyrimidine photolyase-like uncharacterized protein
MTQIEKMASKYSSKLAINHAWLKTLNMEQIANFIRSQEEIAFENGFKEARKRMIKIMEKSQDGDWDFLLFQLKGLGE